MIVYSIIQKLHLEGTKRLDAEYYQPEYLNLDKKLKSLNTLRLGDVVSLVDEKFKPTPGRRFDYVEIAKVDTTTGEYEITEINDVDAPDRAQFVVCKNIVLVSSVRPIRSAVALIWENSKNQLVCSSGFIPLSPIVFSPEYVFIYLKTKPITKLLDRKTTATMYPAVSPKDILDMRIINDHQLDQEVSKLVRGLFVELKNSKSLYLQAEDLLLGELGLKNFEIKDELFNTVNFSDIKNANRIDAEYFQAKYEAIIEVVKRSHKIKNLDEIFNFRRGAFVPIDYYVEEKIGRPYIRIRELTQKGDIDESKIIFINKKYIGDKKDELKKDDLVVAIIGDTIGKTNKITLSLEGGFCSNNTGRLRMREGQNFLSEFNEILFQSDFIQSQIQRKKTQTGQPKINDSEIKSIKIPILSRTTQQKIADLVKKSHESRKKAKELLEEAKHKVEELIENKK